MKKAVSLYSGAGGMDIGFMQAGFEIIWANDYDQDACQSYSRNIGKHIRYGNIDGFLDELASIDKEIDLLIGGPPCQGFSVAGKMDPHDPRSNNVWTYMKVLQLLSPKAFVMENVKALGTLEKWKVLRIDLLNGMRELGYATNYVVLNSSDFNVPQSRERVFFVGFKSNEFIIPDLAEMLKPYRIKAKTVRETLSALDRAGTGNNVSLCKAKITLTPKPVLRKSPFAGMLFNGLGRPIRLDGYCSTLPASMGGNKTPIIDEEELYSNAPGWVQEYHASIMSGNPPPSFKEAPSRLRRLTVEEAALLQTFSREYVFVGSQTSKYKQIGNAVPCELAHQVGRMLFDYLESTQIEKKLIPSVQHSLFGVAV